MQGDKIQEYSTSAQTWRAHTATAEFQEKFEDVEKLYANNNDMRAQKIEEFLINEAVKTGVVTRKIIKESANPNKWEKHMAPWYNEECKEAKQNCYNTRKKYGRNSPPARIKYKQYKQCCAQNRVKLEKRLSAIIKYQPK